MRHSKTRTTDSLKPTKPFYEKWWHSTPVRTFWNTLPEDAGIYRETITVAVERNQNSTNKPISPDLLLRLLLARKGDFLAGGGNTEEEG
ncbi:hypothetical protein AFLA70_5g008301 [Aspergillus flavus AF70]|nr:hypothetical protein AFLA70_5g008301 [Aspergillus flavus AF70]